MAPLSFDLSSLLRLAVNDEALDGLAWRDVGRGARLARLCRAGEASLLLYRVARGAPADAFAPHRHAGGEAYLVLRGRIHDATGSYSAGSLVWMGPGTAHAPRADGETIVLVLWPAGITLDGRSSGPATMSPG